ncbi:MAG: DMT family transporter [Pseudomonadota bacterium]
MQSGIWLIIVAMSMTPALDAVAKQLSSQYDPIFISFVRYLSAGLIAFCLAWVLREKIRMRRRDAVSQLLRTALMMGAMTCFITALSMVPLADAVGGFLIAPMVATGLSVLLMGEVMTRRKTLGAVLSLVGAAAIMRPGLGFEHGTLLALGGGVLLGCYFAASRGTAQAEDVIGAMALQSLLGAAMIAPIAFAGGVPAVDLDLLFWALVLGVISAACHTLTILAFKRTEASTLAPFMYSNLFVAVALGIFVFGEMPAALTWLGLAAILAGGVVTALSPAAIAWLMGPVRLPDLAGGPVALPQAVARAMQGAGIGRVAVAPRGQAAHAVRLAAEVLDTAAARLARLQGNHRIVGSRASHAPLSSGQKILLWAHAAPASLRSLGDELMTFRLRRALVPSTGS